MESEYISQCRKLCHDLNQKPNKTHQEIMVLMHLRTMLIELTGWSRGKKLPDGSYSYLER